MRGPYLRVSEIVNDDVAIVVQRKKRTIDYLTWDSIDDFYRHYTRLHPSQRVYNEVIYEGRQKFRLDIDAKVENIREIICVLKDILHDITRGKKRFRIHVYDIQTSYHVIVSGIAFESSGSCQMVANLVLDRIKNNADAIDVCVYKSLQMFRLEGATKFQQQRWKYRGDRTRLTNSLTKFKEGIISYTQDCYIIDTDIVVQYALDSGVYTLSNMGGNSGIYTLLNSDAISNSNAVQRWKQDRTVGKMEQPIPPGFRIRSERNGFISLDRIYPTFCPTCNRVHEHENAFIIHGKLHCWRKKFISGG